jgi:hypothetical protein
MGWEQNMMRAAAEKLAADNPQGSVARGRGVNNQFVPVPSLEQTNDISNNLIATNNRASATKSAMGTDSGAGLTSSTTSGGKSQMAADLSALIEAGSLSNVTSQNSNYRNRQTQIQTEFRSQLARTGKDPATMGGLESFAFDNPVNQTTGDTGGPGTGTGPEGKDEGGDDDDDDPTDDSKIIINPPSVETVDLFGDQADLINEQLGGLSTKDFTADIKALMAEAEKGAKAVTTQQIKDIAASYGVASGNIDAVAKAATTALNAQESKRKAVQAEVGTIASNQITAMLDRQEADVAAGQALLGENLTSEFAEVVQLTNALINSQAVSAQSSMGRIQAIGNMAAAQRLAAPALMMADAKNALGDERFRLEGQAQAALVKTLNSLSIQEKELVLAEAQRIESFNNNRDAALAQALVNNGMAKLQNTIEEQRLAVASAARASELAAARQASADAAKESARRFELEFGLKKSEAASVQAARIAQTNADTSKAQQKYNTSAALGLTAYGPNVTETQINYINSLSPAMQSDLYTKSINQIDAFNSETSGATFDALRSDGFSPDVSNNALKYVSLENQIELAKKLTENLPSNPNLYSKLQREALVNLATADEGGNTKTSFVMQQAVIENKYPEQSSAIPTTNGSYNFFSQPDNDPRNSFFAAVDRVKAGQSFTMERSVVGAPPGYPGPGGKGLSEYQPFTAPIIDPSSLERKYFMSGRLG